MKAILVNCQNCQRDIDKHFFAPPTNTVSHPPSYRGVTMTVGGMGFRNGSDSINLLQLIPDQALVKGLQS